MKLKATNKNLYYISENIKHSTLFNEYGSFIFWDHFNDTFPGLTRYIHIVNFRVPDLITPMLNIREYIENI